MGLMIAYDPMTMRWLNESTSNKDNNYNSAVFQNGYEDPTYMTFRIEFGGWGASTLDINTFKELLKFNSSQEYGKVHTFNYDEYPVGLLDLNFADDSIKKYPAYSFNEQITYNAYNYLLQRNEDVRAEYIKTFIEGLYEIQKEYPYIFQDISGINNLEQFEPSRGSRLKDATITLKCIEGLGLKVRGLLECYKKAAWDAVYLRWILPENYRQFKMIIYIFERRVFHHVESATDKLAQSQSLGSNIVNLLLSSASGNMQSQIGGLANPMIHHSINPLLPVMAYECNLCEFLLNDSGIGDSFSANWNSSDSLETTLLISVKNVKSYYYNGLITKLSDLMVTDLSDLLLRTDLDYLRTLTYSKSINKEIIYQNDIGPTARPGWGGGGMESISGAIDSIKAGWNTMCNNWKSIFGKNKTGNNNNGNDPASILSMQKASMNAESTLLIEERDNNWWHNATMDLSFSGKGFWKKLLNVVTAGTLQIRLSPGYPNAQSSVFNNILDFLEYNELYEGTYYSYATRSDNLPLKERNSFTLNFDSIPYTEFLSTATRDNKKLSEDDAKSLTDDMTKSETAPGINNRANKIESQYSMVEKNKDNKKFYEHDDTSIGELKMNMTKIDKTAIPENKIITDNNDLLESVNLPEISMSIDMEYPEYTYPNSSMDTVDFVNHAASKKINDTIDFKTYQVQLPALNLALDKSQGNLIIEKENGVYASLLPIEGGLQNAIMDESGMVVLDKTDAQNMLMHSVTTPTEEFTKLDEVFYTTEEMITTMLAESELILNIEVSDDLEHIGNTDNLLEVAAELANEDNTIKAQYAEHISKLLDTLQQETLEVIDYVPEMQLVGYDNPEDANKKYIELPVEAVKQLKDNMQLYSIERPELSHMSMQSMVAIERAAEYAVLNTSALLEVIKQPEIEEKNNNIKQ